MINYKNLSALVLYFKLKCRCVFKLDLLRSEISHFRRSETFKSLVKRGIKIVPKQIEFTSSKYSEFNTSTTL